MGRGPRDTAGRAEWGDLAVHWGLGEAQALQNIGEGDEEGGHG